MKLKYFTTTLKHLLRHLKLVRSKIVSFYRKPRFLRINRFSSDLRYLLPAVLVLLLVLVVASRFHSSQKTGFQRSGLLSSWTYQANLAIPDTSVSARTTQTESIINFRHQNATVEFNLPLTRSTINLVGSDQITFTTKENNIGVDYQLLDNGLKENIVLHQIPSTNQFVSVLKTTNAEIYLNSDNLPVFLDPKTKEYLFHVQKPYAFDAAGNVTYAVSYKLYQDNQPLTPKPTVGKNELLRGLIKLTQGSTYQLIVNVDPDWLLSSSRVYPITIDPTVVHNTQATFATGQLNRVTDVGVGSTNPSLTSYYQELPADINTVGLWHFSEAVSSTNADSSGNGNNGTRSSSSVGVTTGVFGNARTFNGTSTYIRFGSPDINYPAFTLETWIKVASLPSGTDAFIMGKHGSEPVNDCWYGIGLYLQTSGQLYFASNPSGCGNGTDMTGNGYISLNQWHHVAAVFNNGGASIYIDGQLDASGFLATANQDVGSTAYLSIGAWYSQYTGTWFDFFNGAIDEVRVTNSAKSAEEIRLDAQRRPYSVYTSPVIDLGTSLPTAWNSLSWTQAGVNTGNGETLFDATSLVAQWNFNQTSGGTLAVNAGSCTGCTGALTNFSNLGAQDTIPGSGWTTANKRWGAGALMFDGVDDYVNIGDRSQLELAQLTFGSWVNVSQYAYTQVIGKYHNTNEDGYKIEIDGDTGIPYAQIGNGSATPSVDGPVSVVDSKWHYLVATFDGTNLKFYIDAVLVGTTTSSAISYSTESFIIGKESDTSQTAKAVIDSSFVFSRVLTASEILSNYQAGNVEFQTRSGATADPNDGSWDAWKPTTNETAIDTYDGPYQYNTTDSGLIGYWPMDEIGGTAVADVKGSYNGIATGAGIGGGKFGNGRTFNGTSDYISVGTTTPPSALSIDAWVSLTTTGDGNENFVYGNCNVGGSGNTYLAIIDDTIEFEVYNSSVNRRTWDATFNFVPKTWYHVAVTQSSVTGTPNLYVNGIGLSVSLVATAGTPSRVSAPASIGKLGAHSGSNFFNGSIDEVRFYNSAITAATIKQHFLEGSTNGNQLLPSTDTVIKMEGSASQKIQIGIPQTDGNTVGLWHLDEGGTAVGTTFYDSSGNGNNGIATSVPAVVDGFAGKARSFDGSNDYIDLPDGFANFTTGFTVELWAKPTSSADWSRFIDFGNGEGNDNILFARDGTSNDLVFNVYDNTTEYWFSALNVISNNEWHHYAATIDTSGNSNIYKDGQIVATGALVVPRNITRTNNYIGKSNWVDDAYYQGSIDEVRISNVARTDQEIAEAYRAGRDHYLNKTISSTDLSGKTSLPFYVASDRQGTFLNATIGESPFANYQPDANTVGLWHLDENYYSGAAYQANDSSGNGNDGENYSFYHIDDPYSWDDARAICQNMGGDLATIGGNTPDTANSIIADLCTYHGAEPTNECWIGYNDIASEGDFVWARGTSSYTNWDAGEPNDSGGEDCVEIYPDGTWNDGTCTDTYDAICQIPKNSQGKVGQADDFDSWSNGKIIVGNNPSLQLSTNITLEAWVYISDTTPDYSGIIGKLYDTTNCGYGLEVHANNTLFFEIGNCTDYDNLYGVTNLEDNRWHYVVGTASGGTYKVYVDGVLEATSTGNVTLGAETIHELIIGQYVDDSDRYFNGLIDEVRISNVARTAEEIRQAYEVGLRSHNITIDFKAKLVASNLVIGSTDYSFNINSVAYGAGTSGANLYLGDKIIIKQKVGSSEYLAQGTVNAVNSSNGAVTVVSWDAGSTFPTGGYTVDATVFKWQREYFDVGASLSGHRDAITNLTMRVTDGSQGANVWLDDLRSVGNYLTNSVGSTITSTTGNRYFQYRSVLTSSDPAVSPSISSVTLDYVGNQAPNTPTLVTPGVGATNVPRAPSFKTVTTDAESDNLQYEVTICTDSGMTTGCNTYNAASVGWSGANVGTSSFSSGTTATYVLQSGNTLAFNTTYYWKTRAIDPAGSNIWSGTQVTANSFTTNQAPATPALSSPANGATGVSKTPSFKTVTTDPDADTLQYEVKICTDSGMSTGCNTYNAANVGWSGANVGTSSFSSGTTATYVLQAGNSLATNTTYYWKTRAVDIGSSASNLWSATQGSAYSFTTNQAPNTPTLVTPGVGATGVSQTPSFKTVTTDPESDNLQYEVKICTDSGMSTGCQTYNAANVGWSGANVGTSSFSSGTTATYVLQAGNSLATNTTYYWKTRAIDPAGSYTWSGTQVTANSFTTNQAPNTPTRIDPADSASGVSQTPSFKTVTTDPNGDNLQYEVKICTNSEMTTGCQTFTAANVGWSGANVGTSSYSSGTTATYVLQAGNSLALSTTYYWTTRAIDVGVTVSNVWSASQVSGRSFTTGAAPPAPKAASNCRIQETRQDTSLTVLWTDNATDEDHYEVQSSLDGSGEWGVIQTDMAASSTSYQDSSITQGHTYQYRVAPYYHAAPGAFNWCYTVRLSIQSGNIKFEGINFR